jgi:hypothetical protein
MGHDHTRISGHRLTYQAYPFSTETNVPLGQILTDRISALALQLAMVNQMRLTL